ncbi:MAG: flagellar basal body L-ring protein FlgH [Syntrophaceae bacterium]|jgi:flagellar L-ring protein precursor FlgH
MERGKVRGRLGMILLLGAAVLLTAACARNLYNQTGTPPVYSEPQIVRPAGTIWPGENLGNNMYSDKKARYVNDIVTIQLDEASAGANTASTNTSRDGSTAAGIGGIYQIGPDRTILSKYALSGTSSNSLKGDGETTRVGSLSGKITARVIKINASGNMIIEGKRQLTVNNEDQFIIITGIIRPEDISTDNLIYSSNIADARIIYTGKGVVDDKMHPGWMTRVLDWVWPF